ncbi:MAG: TipC family immunity protein [Bacilli bacterium]
MKRKTTVFEIILIIIALVIVYNKISLKFKIVNIYDEIYYDAAKANYWGGGNATRKINGLVFEGFGQNRVHESVVVDFYSDSSLPPKYSAYYITYVFDDEMRITYRYSYNDDIKLVFFEIYNVKSKIINYEISIYDCTLKEAIEKNNCISDMITDKNEVDAYLKKYNISNDEIEAIFANSSKSIFFKDWFLVYRSRFNADDLGEYKIVHNWK